MVPRASQSNYFDVFGRTMSNGSQGKLRGSESINPVIKFTQSVCQEPCVMRNPAFKSSRREILTNNCDFQVDDEFS